MELAAITLFFPPPPPQCPDRQCCSDLLAYLERVKLCCHQLRITSAVRADMDTSTAETVSTGEDSNGNVDRREGAAQMFME